MPTCQPRPTSPGDTMVGRPLFRWRAGCSLLLSLCSQHSPAGKTLASLMQSADSVLGMSKPCLLVALRARRVHLPGPWGGVSCWC